MAAVRMVSASLSDSKTEQHVERMGSSAPGARQMSGASKASVKRRSTTAGLQTAPDVASRRRSVRQGLPTMRAASAAAHARTAWAAGGFAINALPVAGHARSRAGLGIATGAARTACALRGATGTPAAPADRLARCVRWASHASSREDRGRAARASHRPSARRRTARRAAMAISAFPVMPTQHAASRAKCARTARPRAGCASVISA